MYKEYKRRMRLARLNKLKLFLISSGRIQVRYSPPIGMSAAHSCVHMALQRSRIVQPVKYEYLKYESSAQNDWLGLQLRQHGLTHLGTVITLLNQDGGHVCERDCMQLKRHKRLKNEERRQKRNTVGRLLALCNTYVVFSLKHAKTTLEMQLNSCFLHSTDMHVHNNARSC